MSRRRRGSRGGGRGSGLPASMATWIVSSSSVDSAGTQGMGVVQWGGLPQTLAPGLSLTYQAPSLPELVGATNAVPGLSELDIVGIDAMIAITSMSVGGLLEVGLGLYVGEYSSGTTNKWTIRLPTAQNDLAAQEFLHVIAHAIQVPLAAADTMPVSIPLRVVLPFPIRIGAGQALHVTLENNTNSAGTISFVPFIRTKIGRAD